MRRILLATALVGGVMMTAVPAQAASIVNGSFELGVDPGATFTPLLAGSTNITGWSVGGGGVDYIGGYWQAADGVRSVDLSNLSAGSVFQTISTVVGQLYDLTFSLAGNPDGGTGLKVEVTSVAGSLPQINFFNVTGANTRSNMGWQSFIYHFRAFDTQSTITFASATPTPFGPALDNVGISAVPEPATWAMMIGGFGLIGFASRRARRVRAITA